MNIKSKILLLNICIALSTLVQSQTSFLVSAAQPATSSSSAAPAAPPQATPTPTNDPRLQTFAADIDSVVQTAAAAAPAAPAADRADRNRKINYLLELQHNQPSFLQYAQTAIPSSLLEKAVHDEAASQVEHARMDEQFGAGAGGSGSTSAVAKAGITSFLSAAINSGAITQSLNGSTATLSGNAEGVLRFLSGQQPFRSCQLTQVHGCGIRVLRDMGFSVSFDTDQASTTSAATTPANNPTGTPATVNILNGKNKFSGASLKYVFKNPRDVRSKTFRDEWNTYYQANSQQFQNAGNAVLAALNPVITPLLTSPQYVALKTEYRDKMASVTDRDALEKLFLEYLDKQLALARSVTPSFDDQVSSAISAYMRYLGNVGGLLDAITRKPVFSVEYNFERPQGQPDVSHFRLMSTLNPFGPNGTLSVNAAGTFYNSSSVSAQFGRWRDAQASLQLERILSGDLANYPARFSLAGYFQYMISPGLLSLDSGNVVPGTNIPLPQAAAVALAGTGPIWIAEAKVTLKLKNSGAEIPFAITRANRTDLIQATSTRGHIGITYDLDKLFTNK